MKELRNVLFLDTFADLHNAIVNALNKISDSSENEVKVDYLVSLNAKNNRIYLNAYISELGRDELLYLLGDLLIKFTYKNKVKYLVCFLTNKKVTFNWSNPVNKIIFGSEANEDKKGQFYETVSEIMEKTASHNVDIRYGLFTTDDGQLIGIDKLELGKKGFSVFTAKELEKSIQTSLNIYFRNKIFKNDN